MFVVTDLTRFNNRDQVCTALIDVETGRCVRPLPYFPYSLMRQHRVLPGAIFGGNFTPRAVRPAPHVEDCDYQGLQLVRPATRDEFFDVLTRSAHPDVANGFEFQFDQEYQKVLPPTYRGPRSIITIPVSPREIEIVQDRYDETKIKIHFADASGRSFRYMPITDLGFSDYARAHHEAGELAGLNAHVSNSDQVYLRVGLSRSYRAPNETEGFWMQVNGVYTFPEKLDLVRGYEP